MAPAATTTVKTIKRDIPFTWEGKDKRGNRVKGKSLAPDETVLRGELRRQGIAASKIRKQSAAIGRGGKVKPEDIAIFSRQLATMLAAGIPLVQAFEIVGNGNDKPSMQKLILDIKADVEGGTSLHESLGKHPLYFDDLFVNLVEAGEQAGALESLLDKVATYKEKTEALKKKVKKALFYPAAVLVVAVIVTVILLDVRDSAVRRPVQGLRRRPARLHADGHQPVEVRAARGNLHGSGRRRRVLDVFLFPEALAQDAGVPGPRAAENPDHRPDPGQSRRSHATPARSRRCSRPACRWSKPWSRWPARPATSFTRTPS